MGKKENKKIIEWVKPFTRGFFIAYWETGIVGYMRDIKEDYGIGYSNQMYLPEEGGHGFYYGRADHECFKNEILRRAETDREYLEREISLCEDKCEAMVNAAEELAKNSSDRSNLDFLSLYEKYVEEFKDYCFYLEMVHIADVFLEQKAKEELAEFLGRGEGKEFTDIFAIIVTKIKMTAAEKAEIEKLRIAQALQGGKDIEPMVKIYLSKFSWLPCYGLESNPLSRNDLLNELKEIKNPGEQLKEEDERLEARKTALSEIKSKLRDNPELLYWIDIVQQYLYLHAYRTDALRRMMLHLITFLKEIASRAEMDYRMMFYVRPEEIIEFLRGGELPQKEDLERRRKHFAYLVRNKKLEFYSNKEEIEKIRRKEIGEERKEIKEFKGNPAHPGVAKGMVKIIRSKKDWAQLKEGNILVTTMTVPEMLPIIKRSGAIVTDEGGITCHAAIVSRELKIPCIIATKIATKVLKDGDLIEVDTEKGIVKILERAK